MVIPCFKCFSLTSAWINSGKTRNTLVRIPKHATASYRANWLKRQSISDFCFGSVRFKYWAGQSQFLKRVFVFCLGAADNCADGTSIRSSSLPVNPFEVITLYLFCHSIYEWNIRMEYMNGIYECWKFCWMKINKTYSRFESFSYPMQVLFIVCARGGAKKT